MPTLYVVATPIGNLGDFSPRAVETLKNVALIAAEDTRVTQKLLAAFDIHTPLTSCHVAIPYGEQCGCDHRRARSAVGGSAPFRHHVTGNNGTREFFLHVVFGSLSAPDLYAAAEEAAARALAVERYHKERA